jgi:HD-GYP domain-containing protein (c-di-GMP phosphodiesterase class II)
MIAKEMNLSQDQAEGIGMAASIHDIGKISVPAEILSKPSRLSDIEFQLIQIHPEAGYNIVKDIEFPWPIAAMIIQHHERINGSGYRNGLKGEEILMETKILSVADVVEAIASHRPYRPAYGINFAMDELSTNRGILYDPDAVDACLRLFNEKGFKFE